MDKIYEILRADDDAVFLINCEIKQENEIDGIQVFAEIGYFSNTSPNSYYYLKDISGKNVCLVNIEIDTIDKFGTNERVVLDIFEIFDEL